MWCYHPSSSAHDRCSKARSAFSKSRLMQIPAHSCVYIVSRVLVEAASGYCAGKGKRPRVHLPSEARRDQARLAAVYAFFGAHPELLLLLLVK